LSRFRSLESRRLEHDFNIRVSLTPPHIIVSTAFSMRLRIKGSRVASFPTSILGGSSSHCLSGSMPIVERCSQSCVHVHSRDSSLMHKVIQEQFQNTAASVFDFRRFRAFRRHMIPRTNNGSAQVSTFQLTVACRLRRQVGSRHVQFSQRLNPRLVQAFLHPTFGWPAARKPPSSALDYPHFKYSLAFLPVLLEGRC
jgi:hypothetical protein